MTPKATNPPAADPFGVLAALRAGQPGCVPDWPYPAKGAGAALTAVAARYVESILRRLQRAPDKARLAFFDLLGIQPLPAREARAVVVFRMSAGAADARLTAGTRVAASGGPTGQIVFETDHAAGLASAALVQAASFWPGRDQWIDHSAALAAGQAIHAFRILDLRDVPHAIYLAHDTLLALAGRSAVLVSFELATPGSASLEIAWQYWDGALWRDFLAVNPACQETGQTPDSTAGLRYSGRVVLTAACAKTVPVAVNDVTSHWIRGLLTAPLAPDPARVLPEVNSIKLGIQIARPLTFRAGRPLLKPRASLGQSPLIVHVVTDGGAALEKRRVSWSEAGNPMTGESGVTSDEGTKTFSPAPVGVRDSSITVRLEEVDASIVLDVSRGDVVYDVTFKADGLKADKAFADQVALDLTKTFYPFGLAPQAGAAFYFKNDEALSKPGATVQVLVAKAQTPQDQILPVTDPAAQVAPNLLTELRHNVAWEYWDGGDWVGLAFDASGLPVGDLDTTEILSVTVPDDLEPTKVNDVDGYWMRARLVSGGFGKYGVFPAFRGQGPDLPFVLARAPALADFRLGYAWQHGPFPPEHTLTLNDFQFQDRTDAVLWQGAPFPPFQATKEVAPALYLGFDKPLAPDAALGIAFETEEQPGNTSGPALVWEYWDGFTWQDLEATDKTSALRMPGVVSFIGPIDSRPLPRFGTARHWVRARLRADGPPGEPVIDGIFLNAVPVSQRQTIVNEPMGASTGLADQVFAFRQVPVLGEDRVEVRESFGARANVEWRILAQELAGGSMSLVQSLEAQLASEGAHTEMASGDLRLLRDRNKQVVEAWVHWRRQPHFFFSGPNDRHYVVESAGGRLHFGGNGRGMAPPPGAAIQARQYRTGGGSAGNVASGAINQLQGAVGGLGGVFNPQPAGGGADGETVEALLQRGPGALRRRGRGLSASDYETLAREASPIVAAAHALAARGPDGVEAPGWMTLVLIPRSDAPRPWPSFALREEVLAYLAERGPADIVGQQIHLTGPDYQAVDVAATLVPLDPTQAGDVAQRARDTLLGFLHPLDGGPAGAGWPPNRPVYLSDVAAALERVEGIDYVRELTLLLDGAPQGDSVRVSGGRVVAAGDIRLKVVPGKTSP